MALCVYSSDCNTPAIILFKGRMLCPEHAREVRKKIEDVLSSKEKRENRTISEFEQIAITSQRFVQTNRGPVPVRGTRFRIAKNDLRLMVNDF